MVKERQGGQIKSQQQQRKMNEELILYKDALDIENHQHLPVLFCSFFYNQKGASSFCAPPTLLDMKFYGQHDIMLGQFLHRYCFRLWTDCSRCHLPMLGHIRRYVHSMGCVKVFLNEDNSENHPESNHIYFTAWCNLCNEMTPTVILSESSKCLSLAKYLELRFHGHGYKKRHNNTNTNTNTMNVNNRKSIEQQNQLIEKCSHSLHRDYVHQFSYRGVAAKFQYTPIETWEISLPTLELDLHPPLTYNRYEVLEEVKNFSMRGHDIYTRIHERIADLMIEDDNNSSNHSKLVNNLKNSLNQNQLLFKQHIEIIQTILTEVKATYYDINDALLMTKRILAESIERWEPRLHECIQKLNIKQSMINHETSNSSNNVNPYQMMAAPTIDPGTICNEDFIVNNELNELNSLQIPGIGGAAGGGGGGEEQQQPHLTSSSNDQGHNNCIEKSIEMPIPTTTMMSTTTTTTASSSSSGDKKTIKKMLNQLLPSSNPVVLLQSPFPSTEHYTLPLGSFPIIVNDQDLSSIVAYSLTCQDYKRALASLNATGMEHGTTTTTTTMTVGGSSAGLLGGNTNLMTGGSPHGKRRSQEWWVINEFLLFSSILSVFSI